MAAQSDVPIVNALIALIWWAMLTLLASYIGLKSSKLRVVLDDQPSIIIKDGAIMSKEMKKTAQQEATKQDVQAAVPTPKYLPTELITEGKIRQKNLVELKVTEDWLMKQLRKKGVESVEQVFLAQIQTDGSLFIDLGQRG